MVVSGTEGSSREELLFLKPPKHLFIYLYLSFEIVCTNVLYAGALKEPLSSLRFIQEPAPTIARKNKAVTLDCEVEGYLPPIIRWTRNGKAVHQNSRKIILPSGSLLIRRILHKRDYKPDAGEYQCFASSSVGTIASRKVLLDVAGKRDVMNP